MVTIPAVVWRAGFVSRALIVGGCVGLSVGLLGWLDSGILAAGAIVFVVVGTVYVIWTARQMTKYWPESVNLTGDERVTVVRAAREGTPPDDARLAGEVAGYSRGLHRAAHDARPLRWVFRVVLVVAAATAVWDWVNGSWGNAIVSAIYLAALIVEVFWVPKWQTTLLANADRAAGAYALEGQGTEEHRSRKKR